MAENLCSGRPCRGRGWCSREKRQAAVQLVLLCVASCSWTLLLISLTLTTSASKPRHAKKAVADSGPQWTEGGADACEECLSRRGPPKSYWQVFERKIQQIAAALDRLDQPLAPPALRAQLQTTRTLLRRLATVLHMPLINTPEHQQTREFNHEAVLAAPGRVDGRLACPEQFLGPKAGYPHYHHGYMSINCSSLPLRNVLTAVLWDIEKEHLSNLLHDFKRVYPGLPIHLISNTKVRRLPNLSIENSNPSIGEGLRRIFNQIKTPYVFLGPRLTSLNNHSRLERLVWVAEWSGVWAVGGAGKGQDGHWRAGCLQATEGEGQLMYSWGYTTSLFECQLCHALEAPLVIRTKAVQELEWPNSNLASKLLFPSMFLNIHRGARPHKHGAAVCPDSMFMVSSIEPPWDMVQNKVHQDKHLHQVAALWHPVAKHCQLSRLRLPSGIIVNYPCDFLPGIRQGYSSGFSPTSADRDITASWACQKRELNIILGDLTSNCSMLKVKCYLREPTLSALLSGGSLQEFSNKTIYLAVNDKAAVSSIQTQMKASYYSSYREVSSLVLEGRWWKVSIHTDERPSSNRWMSVEVLEGIKVPAALPSEKDSAFGGTKCAALAFDVRDSSVEEHMSELTSSSCHHNRLSDMTLKSP